MSHWEFDQLLQKVLVPLRKKDAPRAMRLLADLLAAELQADNPNEQGNWRRDRSPLYLRRLTAIDLESSWGKKGVLVRHLIELAGEVGVEDAVGLFRAYPWTLFRRLALQAARTSTETPLETIADLLAEERMFDDGGVRREYSLLLRAKFKELPARAKETILGWIEAGPDVSAAAELGGDDEGYAERWRRDRLAPMADALTPEWGERLRALVERHGEPSDAAFGVGPRIHTWVGPTSPKSVEDLEAMGPEAVREFLMEWKPDSSDETPSPEGLGRLLRHAVKANGPAYGVLAPKFKGIAPTYLRAIIEGLEEAHGSGMTLPWTSVLELIGWIVAQPRDLAEEPVRREADAHWGWCRQAIGSLLMSAMTGPRPALAPSCREATWSALSVVAEDPDPTPEADQHKPYGDPSNHAINSVRGVGIRAVIVYACWCRHLLEQGGAKVSDEELAHAPEARALLERHLDIAIDPSLAVHSVYGRYFSWLVYAGRSWASRMKELIFPTTTGMESFRRAAWQAYMNYGGTPLSRPAVEMLEDLYLLAIREDVRREDMTHEERNAAGQVAGHVMTLFIHGHERLDDDEGLLHIFFREGADHLRRDALMLVPGWLDKMDRSQFRPDLMDELARLWEWRLEEAKSSEGKKFAMEVAAFGRWFASGHWDEEWALRQLRDALSVVGYVELDFGVAEKLISIASRQPVAVLECLERMIDGPNLESFWLWERYAREVIRVALGVDTGRERALALASRLCARGFRSFEHLLASEAGPAG